MNDYFDKQDLEKAEEMTRREMMDEASRGMKWKNKYDFADSFKEKTKANLGLVKASPLLVIGIIAFCIIAAESNNPKRDCDHDIDKIEYTLDPYKFDYLDGYRPGLSGKCERCDETFTIRGEGKTFISSIPETCTNHEIITYEAIFTIKETQKVVQYQEKGKKALGHLKGAITQEYIPATCTSEGKTEAYICDRCGYESISEKIPMTPHVEIGFPQIDPTCQTQGQTAYSVCQDCEKVLISPHPIDVIPCYYEGVVTEPTYTTMGYTTHTCTMCSDTYIDSYVNALVYNDFDLVEINYNGRKALAIKSVKEGFNEEDIVIPKTIDGLDVVEISDSAFMGCKMKSITIPDTVTKIGDFAFYGCSNLESIDMPETISTIGRQAFRRCLGFKDFRIPDSVEVLKSGIFSECENLENIDLNNVKRIEEEAFKGCINLYSIVLPETVEVVDNKAFTDCVRLFEIYDLGNKFSNAYPRWTKSIKTSLDENSGYETYGVYECIRGTDNILYCYNVVPESTDSFTIVKTINDEDYEFLEYALYNIKDCVDLTICKASNVSIDNLFTNYLDKTTPELKVNHLTLDIDEEIPYGYLHKNFNSVEKLTINNIVSNGVIDNLFIKELEMNIVLNKLSDVFHGGVPYELSKVTFKGGEVLPNNYFSKIDSLVEVILPDELTTIGDGAFTECENLEKVTFGNNLTKIGKRAFNYCYKLKDLDLPESLEFIDEFAFMYCHSLETIIIPKNVTTIEYCAFDECSGIKQVYNLSSLDIKARTNDHGSVARNVYYVYTSLDEEAKIFYEEDFIMVLGQDGKYHLVAWLSEDETAVLPVDFKGESYILDSGVFNQNSVVKNLTISSGVSEIKEQAFLYTYSLENVVIESGITTIKDKTFYGCSNLTNITLPASLESIGLQAFYDCASSVYGDIKTVYFDGDIYSWMNIDFASLDSNPMYFADQIRFKENGEYVPLTSLVIPEETKVIKDYVCYKLNDIVSLKLPVGIKDLGSYNFSGITSLKYVEMPAIYGLGLNSIEEIVISTDVPDSFFSSFINIKKVTVLEGVDYIGKNAFKNRSKLEEVIIPKTVTTIKTGAFDGCSSLKTLTIDVENENYSSLEEGFCLIERKTNTLLIGNETSIIPEGVVNIASYAFYNNDRVTNMVIPSSVKTIGDYAFYGCRNLNDIKLNSNIESIGNNAFAYCSNITSADFSDLINLKQIGDYAFDYCYNINEIKLSESLENIGRGIFDSRVNITELTITSVCSRLSWLFSNNKVPTSITTVNVIGDVGNNYFSGCSSIEKINIENATSIGSEAFMYCSKLVDITIPESVKTIGDAAFFGCTSLEELVLPNDLKVLSSSLFYNCINLNNLTLPSSLKKISSYTFYGCKKIGVIDLSLYSDLEEIGNSAFYECEIKELMIPENVKLYRSSLAGIIGLESLIIPKIDYDGVKTIYDLFGQVLPSSLKKVELLSATIIPEKAFNNCSTIETIIIPDSVINIGKDAFNNCSGLTYNVYEGINYVASKTNPYFIAMSCLDSQIETVNLHNDCKILYQNLFSSKRNITNVTLPEGLLYIGDYAFYNCYSLEEVTLPSTLKGIGNYAFSQSAVKQIKLPSSLEILSNYSFYKCSSLHTVFFMENCKVSYLGAYAFAECGVLGSVTFKDNCELVEVGERCFYNCISISYIKLPKTVEVIGNSAFVSCTGLQVVTFEEGSVLREIKDYAFQNCKKLREIVISKTVEKIGRAFNYIWSSHIVYYGGSESDWNNIEFGVWDSGYTYSTWLTYAQIWYNYEI